MNPLSDTAGAGDATAHRDAQDALPWLANGTLVGAELARVRAHVDGCALCRADLAGLRTLHAAGHAPALPAAIDGELDMDRAFARLLPQLDAVAQAHAPPPAPSAAQPIQHGWRARLAANDGRWLRTAAALQCCVIAVLALLLLRPSTGLDAAAGAYRALGAGPGAQAALVVAFRPDTPERELRRIVLAGGARIVGGPTPTGAWLLATDAAPDQVAQRLRTEAAVLLAEPLAPAGPP